jgi:transcriptional regulator of acetoin/glycerol metabolism
MGEHMREITSNQGAIVRARDLFFNEGTLPQGLVQDAVLRSWQRCAQRGRNAGEAIEFNHVSGSAVSDSAERNRCLIMASQSPVLRLAHSMTGAGYGILVTDREGACVAVQGPIDSCSTMLRQALRPGVDLSETAVATNAMAIAMAEGRPIGIRGPEHFFLQNQTFQCVAAPIFDASGAVAGSIDITRDTAAPQFGALSLVLDCAAAIEMALFLQTPAHCLVTLSWSIEAAMAIPPALIALGADGEVLAVSHGARKLLELRVRLTGLRYEDLFHGSYAQFMDHVGASNHASPLPLQSGLRIFARQLVAKGGQAAAGRAAAGPRIMLPEFGDEACQAALHRATRALGARLPVLLRGETGTGKEVAARALHAKPLRETPKTRHRTLTGYSSRNVFMTAYLAATPAQSTPPPFLRYRAPCGSLRALYAAWLPRLPAQERSGCPGPLLAMYRALQPPPSWPASLSESSGAPRHPPASGPASRPALPLLREAPACMFLSVS